MNDWNKLESLQLIEMIGESIKGRRRLKNMSQNDLAERSGVSSPSISRLETGKGNISSTGLLSILKALGMANKLKTIFKSREKSPARHQKKPKKG